MAILNHLRAILLNRWSAPRLASLTEHSIAGRTVLVTGASTGLGLEAARHYARLGAARIILGVRSLQKGEAAKRSIEDTLRQNRKKDLDDVEICVWELDLASFNSVRRFAEKVLKELDTLDVAVLSAAVSKTSFQSTDDGWEETLQVNTLSNILLAQLILPKLRSSRRGSEAGEEWIPRLEFVASRSYQLVKQDAPWQREANWLAALNTPETFESTSQRYGTSKLFLIYCVREIAASMAVDGIKGPEVIVNYSCPGACKSDLAREWNTSHVKSFFLWMLQETICKTTEEGARTLVYATCLGEESHGKWVHNNALEEPGKSIDSDKGMQWQKRVWGEVGEVLEAQGFKK